MRRWNGWAEEGPDVAVPEAALTLLARLVGPGSPSRDVALESVVARVPPSRLVPHAYIATEAVDRIRHATGQSFSDWVAMRSGRYVAFPDGVARPTAATAVRELLELAGRSGAVVVPYGGGTSVVGGVTPADPGRPTLTVALEALVGLRAIDRASGLATFGAGTTGPDLERTLRAHGLTLGHSPQSFHRSTLGGWVATRSAGHASMGVGRIEDLFAGGHVEAPGGAVDLPPHPASAAGPDLRQLILGSEGRFGIITDVTVRAMPPPDTEAIRSWFLPSWEAGLEAARSLARAGVPLSMVRLSTPAETSTFRALGRPSRLAGPLDRYLAARGIGPSPSLLIVATQGRRSVVAATLVAAGSIVHAAGGVGTVADLGGRWLRGRFRSAQLRDALWSRGYGIDTLETAVDWATLPELAAAVEAALRDGLAAYGERVHAFSHLSHVYPSGSSLYTTYVFRLAADPDENLARWRALKGAASDEIVRHGATISHQHGVGRDHAPYLEHEKGALGMELIEAVKVRLDPDGVMNPGVLLATDDGVAVRS
ncbi:MAG TPA: FAD-binding oxidoreductase [Candidatus Limnocylindrales bacterium]|nr:FAD-binding oxidoreductase [Candidatus Limnocylindrales bacterium]